MVGRRSSRHLREFCRAATRHPEPARLGRGGDGRRPPGVALHSPSRRSLLSRALSRPQPDQSHACRAAGLSRAHGGDACPARKCDVAVGGLIPRAAWGLSALAHRGLPLVRRTLAVRRESWTIVLTPVLSP